MNQQSLHIAISAILTAVFLAALIAKLAGCAEPVEPMTRAEQCQIWNKYCDNGMCGGCP